ncbi:hypothetical protein UM181_00750 [Alphaproteobacteria bacterium US3C007]|jgi:hypothetical protein|nr:hypothetical protein UM181_00750 [Alphaproteobacteria bacterium US3C007]
MRFLCWVSAQGNISGKGYMKSTVLAGKRDFSNSKSMWPLPLRVLYVKTPANVD